MWVSDSAIVTCSYSINPVTNRNPVYSHSIKSWECVCTCVPHQRPNGWTYFVLIRYWSVFSRYEYYISKNKSRSHAFLKTKWSICRNHLNLFRLNVMIYGDRLLKYGCLVGILRKIKARPPMMMINIIIVIIISIYLNCKWDFPRWQWYYNRTQHTNNTPRSNKAQHTRLHKQ
jgi:hypothetical protein